MHRCYNDTPLFAQKLQQNKESVTIRGKLAFAVRLKSHDLPGPHAVLELGFVLLGILGRRGWRRMREIMGISTRLKSVLRRCVVCSAAWWSAWLTCGSLGRGSLVLCRLCSDGGGGGFGRQKFCCVIGLLVGSFAGILAGSCIESVAKNGKYFGMFRGSNRRKLLNRWAALLP